MQNNLKLFKPCTLHQHFDNMGFSATFVLRQAVFGFADRHVIFRVWACFFTLFVFLSNPLFSQNIDNKDIAPIIPESGEIGYMKNNCAKLRVKPRLMSKLPPALHETSGLILFDGQLWTINDGGNPAELYQIDTANGQVLRAIKISNSANSDWEGLAQDNSNVYIGDFGNNAGNRTNLRVLKINKSALLDTANTQAEAQIIHFRYPDQTDFTASFNNNNFDCEAFFYHNGQLHLFTKNWGDKQSRHYSLPSDSGSYVAHFIEQFDADGLITDATINKSGNMVLLGYEKTWWKFYASFAWLIAANNRGFYFDGNKKRVGLGSVLHVGQSEGIFLKNDNSAFISSESILNGWFRRPAKLLMIDLDACFDQ
jgi:hypothetical protein